ncbi:hypothetical protein C0993_005593, partial [Termitomyces sp. T159_Od127]
YRKQYNEALALILPTRTRCIMMGLKRKSRRIFIMWWLNVARQNRTGRQMVAMLWMMMKQSARSHHAKKHLVRPQLSSNTYLTLTNNMHGSWKGFWQTLDVKHASRNFSVSDLLLLLNFSPPKMF